MGASTPRRLPPGRQIYDPLRGLHIGAVVGSVLGATVALFAGVGMVWLIVGGAALGGGLGYRRERRKLYPDERGD
jgi:hypothetical protein